jgi:hypothetical protein
MHYMMIVKGTETGEQPPQALFDAIDALIQQQIKDGILVGFGGLKPTAEGARVSIKGNRVHVTDGPFAESKEVIGGYSILEAASREDAIRMAREFMDLHVQHWPGWEGECEVRELAAEG